MTETWTNRKDGSAMRRIPAGEFIMGSTHEQIKAAIAMDKGGAQFPLLHETPQFRAFCNAARRDGTRRPRRQLPSQKQIEISLRDAARKHSCVSQHFANRHSLRG